MTLIRVAVAAACFLCAGVGATAGVVAGETGPVTVPAPPALPHCVPVKIDRVTGIAIVACCADWGKQGRRCMYIRLIPREVERESAVAPDL